MKRKLRFLRSNNAMADALGLAFSARLQSSLFPDKAGSATPTFTRATTAYVTDFEGLLKPVLSGEVRFTGARRVRNWVNGSSENFSNAGWVRDTAGTGSLPALTSGQPDPWGGTTATRIVLDRGVGTAAGDTSRIYNNTGAANALTESWWVKSNTGATQTVKGGLNGGTRPTLTITTSWQRFSFPSGTTYAAWAHTGDDGTSQVWDLLIARAQAEEVTGQSNQNCSEYVSVGVLSAPFHGANVDGVKYFTTQNGNTVSSNVVTEATGAAISNSTLLGYNAEGARTNYALWNRDLTNAAWVSGGGGIATAKTATGADGVANSATTLTASGANGTLLQTITRASAQRVTGCYIKRRTGTGTINMTQDNGATWTVVTPTASWAAVAIPAATAANPIIGFRIVTAADAIDVDFVTHDEAAFVSSVIPTTTVSVTRNADVLTYPSSGNISAPAFSVYAEYSSNANAAISNHVIASLSAGGTYGAGNGALFRVQTPSVANVGGNGSTASVAVTGSFASPTKLAGYFNTSGTVMRVFAQGTAGAEVATLDWTGVGTTSINIGNLNSTTESQHAFGNIRNIRLYSRQLSNLQAMTT